MKLRAKTAVDEQMPAAPPLSKSSKQSPPKRAASPQPSTHTKPKKQPFILPQRYTIVGDVFVSGSNEAGQLGLGELDDNNKYRPKRLSYFDDKHIVAVFCGGMHSIALSLDGKLYSWGCNDDKALGRQGDEMTPHPLTSLHHEHIITIACGDSISLALTNTGRVYSWGTFRDSRGLFGHTPTTAHQHLPTLLPLSSIVHISCGTNHAIAISKEGKVFSWGVGEQGQLGRKIVSRHTIEASLLPRPSQFKPVHEKSSVFVKSWCGSFHTFLEHESGKVYAFGLNNYGQLGIGEEDEERDGFEPVEIVGVEGEKVKEMSAGEHHSLFLSESGKIFAVGRNDDGQLGLANGQKAVKTFTPLPFSLPVVKIGAACGGYFSFALTAENEDNLWMWGYGESGQLAGGSIEGDMEGELIGEGYLVPENIDLKGRCILHASAGGQHSVFLIKKKDGE